MQTDSRHFGGHLGESSKLFIGQNRFSKLGERLILKVMCTWADPKAGGQDVCGKSQKYMGF